MRLVVDTSIIFSLFKSDSITNKILSENTIELFAPKELINELKKYSDTICTKSNISEKDFLLITESLSEIIKFKTPSKNSVSKASKLISHKSDSPFLALAMELNIPIWSNDKHFKEQELINIFTTEELIKYLRLPK